MDETRVKVEMEGGMWFEFSGREEEEQQLPPSEIWVLDRQVPDPLFRAQIVFFDVTNPDTNENHQVIGVEEILTRRLFFARSLEYYFKFYLGHGLTPQELSNCVQQFSVVANHIIDHPSPPGNGSDYRRRRALCFDVKRRGVLGTRYHAREIEMQEEDVECRNRWNRMLEKGISPAKPSAVDEILGNMDWRRAIAIEDVCPICLEEFRSGEDATRMPCYRPHCFHTHCIARWLCRSYRCPLCRYPIPRLYAPSYPSSLPNPYL